VRYCESGACGKHAEVRSDEKVNGQSAWCVEHAPADTKLIPLLKGSAVELGVPYVKESNRG
jgi:hypothetical protein